MIEKIRNNPRLKQFVIGLISPHKHPRPRLWVRWFVNPFVHKKAAVRLSAATRGSTFSPGGASKWDATP